MVYYGRLSQGCQRCRRRKVKCDERKPECQRCEKAGVSCPGFRNLADVSFRDESQRIIRRCNRRPPAPALTPLTSQTSQPAPGPPISKSKSSKSLQPAEPEQESESQQILSSTTTTGVPPALFLPLAEHAASFFFTHYARKGPPVFESCYAWLQCTYREVSPSHPLRVAIDSAGMAGLSRVFCVPDVAVWSRVLHGQALVSTNRTLADPKESVSDVTLMAVLLLAIYELVNPHNWEHYRSMATHIRGATALIWLRGPRQFDSEVGANLFVQFRSLLLYSCMQADVSPPPVFARLNRAYMASRIGQICETTNPRPLGNMFFQLLDLRVAIRDGTMTDPVEICRVAAEMNKGLNIWMQDLDPSWDCTTVETGDSDNIADDLTDDACFERKRHVYACLWAAQMWTNWRTLRILVNQVLLQNEPRCNKAPAGDGESPSLAIVRQMSSDICISSANFRTTPRVLSTVWPLSVVYRESRNHPHVRSWALGELHRIGSSMGLGEVIFSTDSASIGPCASEGQRLFPLHFPKQGYKMALVI